MLISMPTGTTTIFGVFQVIRVSQVIWRIGATTKLGLHRTKRKHRSVDVAATFTSGRGINLIRNC